ncbi:sodium/proton antiporter (CPA1 family) [Sediminihabitans luteus]|uniref:Sodium/proton antiporter (CPA1 family) n=1 Tax=Sediminihabitans luteus TaxID=1138585 RepID=A0A2M9CZM1_9CELL|nr:Na+/H+ antiporter [Sediminihabitans luteus]PJJ77382.1 sodium/proton antiporter (CPA1 family) [Sediminihabitans luteus]GII98275.1 Na+/H+ antiporter [Sediminihabitans luteus]
MSTLLLFAVLLAGIVVLTPLADRLRVPLPVLLTVFGLLVPLVPATPAIRVDPEYILPLVLPPLLFAATQRSTAREFKDNARPILLLAVGLTIASAGAVAWLAHLGGIPWGPAWVLGAIVAPPDPVAATAVARRLKLPGRIVTVLEGEGMFNDATALVLYHVAVAAVVTGEVTAGGVGLDLLLAVVGGIVVGLVGGWLGHLVLGRLHIAAAETTVTLALPFAAYLVAEEVHGSGVLAVLTLGLLLRTVSHTSITSGGWLLGRAVWEYADYLITAFVFVLIGFELTEVLESSPVAREALPLALGIVALLVVLRFVWMFPAVLLVRARTRREGHGDTFTNKETTVISWAGMRGVVTVASALALPYLADGGEDFPHRDDLVFIGLVVVLATLVLQGLTLSPLVKRLGVGSEVDEAREVAALRERASRAALASVRETDDVPEAVRDSVAEQYEGYLRAQITLRRARAAGRDHDDEYGRYVDALLRRANEVERAVVITARNAGEVSPEVADAVLEDVEARAVRDLD